MKEPTRLRDQPDVPRSLVEALGVLHAEVQSAEVIARIERELQALPAQPVPHMPWPKSFVVGACAVVLGATATMATLTTLTTLTTWRFSRHEAVAPRQPRVVQNAEPAASPPSAATPAPSDHALVAPAALTSTPRPSHATRPSPMHERRTPAPRVTTTSTAETESQPARASEQTATSEPSPAARKRDEPIDEPQDEAGLLFRAKAVERRDPAAALDLLALHERFFPTGKYVEERDALAIRLHQRLGHRARAAELARQFRARFPGSVYAVTLPE